MSDLPESIERELGERPDSSVIWLHGLGADGHEDEPAIRASQRPLEALVARERGRRSREALESNGYAVEWHEYPMGHEVCPQEIDAISTWIARVL